MSRKKTFLLKNIDIARLESAYDCIQLTSNISKKCSPLPSAILINSLVKPDEKQISFLSDTKNNVTCFPVFMNFKTGVFKLNNELKETIYNCFWCRHHIPSKYIPIPIPIKYVPHRIVKKYTSNIKNNSYFIPEDVSELALQRILKDEKDENAVIENNDYYFYDGLACSWNCALAFILDNRRDPTYELSKMLLFELYFKFNPNSENTPKPAQSWRLLIEYGGIKTIEEFRKDFENKIHIYHGTTTNFKFAPIIHLFESKIVI